MEYIQCTHCHKKYRVNEQVRAAAGRMVKCKDCGERIEIIIFQDSDDSPPDANDVQQEAEKRTADSQAKEQAVSKETAIEPEPKANINKQKHDSHQANENHPSSKKITLSAILGVFIIAGSLYGFFQGRSQQADDLHQDVKADNASQTMHQKHEMTFEKPLLKSKLTIPQEKKNVSGYSDACKEAAAQQWLTDFKVSHGKQTGHDYMSLLDQGIQTSALIRKECGGSHVVAEVLQAAQKGLPPEWLVKTINELTGNDLGNEPSF
ncbi:MAG: zinc-ribbon domain-containing protein [Mariprofundaceae bacterium]|nr:zinc-ribbon domain-containing protein [Mariprofundaceae bacterium]